MADTVFEYPDETCAKISFTRFWSGGQDWVQITIIPVDGNKHEYQMMPFSEFEKAYLALKENVEQTKDAWWHELSKQKSVN